MTSRTEMSTKLHFTRIEIRETDGRIELAYYNHDNLLVTVRVDATPLSSGATLVLQNTGTMDIRSSFVHAS